MPIADSLWSDPVKSLSNCDYILLNPVFPALDFLFTVGAGAQTGIVRLRNFEILRLLKVQEQKKSQDPTITVVRLKSFD